MIGAAVVGRVAARFDLLEVAVADAADVADRVRGVLAIRILSKQAGVDLDAGEAVAVCRELRYFLLGQSRADRQALEALALVHQALEALAVLGGDLHDGRESGDGGFEIGHLARGDLERVGGVVVGEHDPVAVQDQPAVRDNGNDRDAVVFGQCVIVVVLHDLDVEEAGEKDREEDDNHASSDGEPDAKAG